MYDEKQRAYTLEYLKKQKQISIFFKQDEYNENILPAIRKSGLGPTTFVKAAVRKYAKELLADESQSVEGTNG